MVILNKLVVVVVVETESENPERREFDYQSLPGGGEFDPHALGVGNLNCTLDFM